MLGADLRYSVITNSTDLSANIEKWWQLWSDSSVATPFQSPAWLLPWWDQFGEGHLRFVIVEIESETLAILPFYLYVEPQTGERKLLLMGVGTSDYLDAIYADRCTPEQLTFGLRQLLELDDWDVLHAGQLREDSLLLQALRAVGAGLASVSRGDPCSAMLASSIADLPQKIRRNAMYYRNRAARNGDLQLNIADASNVNKIFDVLVEQHSARWEEAGQAGVLADPRVLAWHRDAVGRLEHKGLLRLYYLTLDGSTLGVLYALIDSPERKNRRLYVYLPSFSLQHRDLRPGTLLLAQVSEQAMTEGVRTIDLLRGNESYKANWHVDRVDTAAVEILKQGNCSHELQTAEVFV